MIDLVQRYYAGERQTALLGVGLGLALMLIAGALWRTSPTPALARGMAYALLAAGALQAAASGSYAVVVARRTTDAVEAYSKQPEPAVLAQEKARMRRVLDSGYTGALAFNTALLVVGVVLVFASHEALTRKGIALALMIVGVLGHGFEAFSMQKNRQYVEQVEARGP